MPPTLSDIDISYYKLNMSNESHTGINFIQHRLMFAPDRVLQFHYIVRQFGKYYISVAAVIEIEAVPIIGVMDTISVEIHEGMYMHAYMNFIKLVIMISLIDNKGSKTNNSIGMI